jgi:predicted Zn-dependent protease
MILALLVKTLRVRAVAPIQALQIWMKFGATSIASWADCLDLSVVDQAVKVVVRVVRVVIQEAQVALVVDSTPTPERPNWA